MEEVGTTILSERHCHLGEGPTYDPATDTAWWFDILERTLLQADLASGRHHHARASRDGQRAGCHRRPPPAARRRHWTLHPRRRRRPPDAPHAARSRQCGDALQRWDASIPAARSGSEPWGARRKKAAGAIYRFHRGELSLLYAGVTIPNAICFSPDGATAYFTDTKTALLQRVAIDP